MKVFKIFSITFKNNFRIEKLKERLKDPKKSPVIILLGILFLVAIGFYVYQFYNNAVRRNADIADKSLILYSAVIQFSLFVFLIGLGIAERQVLKPVDYSILSALPVSKGKIITAKILFQLLTSIILFSLLFITTGIGYLKVTNGGLKEYLLLILVNFTEAFFVGFLGLAIGLIFSLAFKRTVKSNTISSIIYAILAIVLTVAMTLLNSIKLDNISSYKTLLGYIFYPAKLTEMIIVEKNIYAIILFPLVVVLLFASIIMIISRLYTFLNTNKNHLVKTSRNLKFKSRNPKTSMLIKEFKMLFQNQNLFISIIINTAIIPLVFIVSYVSIAKNPNVKNEVSMIIASSAALFPLYLVSPSPISLSLEGSKFWIVKSLPVKIKDLLLNKVLSGILVGIPAVIVISLGSVYFQFKLNLSFYYPLLITLEAIIIIAGSNFLGVFINIMIPKLTDDFAVIKRSLSYFVYMMTSIILGSLGLFLMPFLLRVLLPLGYSYLTVLGILVAFPVLPLSIGAILFFTVGVKRAYKIS